MGTVTREGVLLTLVIPSLPSVCMVRRAADEEVSKVTVGYPSSVHGTCPVFSRTTA
jgi:hypothetical protein